MQLKECEMNMQLRLCALGFQFVLLIYSSCRASLHNDVPQSSIFLHSAKKFFYRCAMPLSLGATVLAIGYLFLQRKNDQRLFAALREDVENADLTNVLLNQGAHSQALDILRQGQGGLITQVTNLEKEQSRQSLYLRALVLGGAKCLREQHQQARLLVEVRNMLGEQGKRLMTLQEQMLKLVSLEDAFNKGFEDFKVTTDKLIASSEKRLMDEFGSINLRMDYFAQGQERLEEGVSASNQKLDMLLMAITQPPLSRDELPLAYAVKSGL